MPRTFTPWWLVGLLAAPAWADDGIYGPPSTVPAATPVVVQVRMVQEGRQLRLLVDAMGGDRHEVEVLRPVHAGGEPLLANLQLSILTPDQLATLEAAEFAALEAADDTGLPAPTYVEPPEGRELPIGPLSWRVGLNDRDRVTLPPGIWTPIAEARLPLPTEALSVGGRVTLRSDVVLTLAGGPEVVPAPDVSAELLRPPG